MAPAIIKDNRSLFEQYDDLSAGDIVLGRVRLNQGEEHILLDMVSRGIILIPSATAQLCSRSKVFQTRLLGRFMIPGTYTVYSKHQMMIIVSEFGRQKEKKVVCKLDRANGGLGILLFPSIEEVYAQASLGVLSFPFVVQPFIDDCVDVRVVMLGERMEAYRRHNPDNFRHNLHCGGESSPWNLSEDQEQLCRKIMNRAGFPYAHIDLLITPSGNIWLNEINLRGGLRGAVMSQEDYIAGVEKIHADIFASHT